MSVKIRQFGNARIIDKYALFSFRDIIHIFNFNYCSRLQQDMHGCRLVTNKVSNAQEIMKFKFVSVAKNNYFFVSIMNKCLDVSYSVICTILLTESVLILSS